MRAGGAGQDVGHGQGDHARKDDAARAPGARDRVQAAFVHPALGLAEVLQGSALLGEDGGREGDVRAVGRVEARVVFESLWLPAGEGDLLLGVADVGRQAQDDRAAQGAGQGRLELLDERDRLIGLKSMRFGFAIAGIGFVSGLLTLLFDYAPAVMLNIMFVSFSLGSILEGIVQIYYYRKGVNHG